MVTSHPPEARKLNGVHILHNVIPDNCALKRCGIISYGDYAAPGKIWRVCMNGGCGQLAVGLAVGTEVVSGQTPSRRSRVGPLASAEAE